MYPKPVICWLKLESGHVTRDDMLQIGHCQVLLPLFPLEAGTMVVGSRQGLPCGSIGMTSTGKEPVVDGYRNWLGYGLRWSGWYCNPAQHELCQPSRGRPARVLWPDCITNHDSADRISGQFLFYHDHNFTKSKGNLHFQCRVPLSVPISVCVTTHDDGTASYVTIGMLRHNQQATTTSAMANLGFHFQNSLAMLLASDEMLLNEWLYANMYNWCHESRRNYTFVKLKATKISKGCVLFWSCGPDGYRKNDRKRAIVWPWLVLELRTVLALTQWGIWQSDWRRAGISSTYFLI